MSEEQKVVVAEVKKEEVKESKKVSVDPEKVKEHLRTAKRLANKLVDGMLSLPLFRRHQSVLAASMVYIIALEVVNYFTIEAYFGTMIMHLGPLAVILGLQILVPEAKVIEVKKEEVK